MSSTTTTDQPDQSRLMDGYSSPEGFYDEVFVDGAAARPHWQEFLSDIESLGRAEFLRRWEQSQRLIHESGITFEAYGESKPRSRPWELDPLPHLVSGDEWRQVSQGLVQRARLLNLILADLYGPQELIRRNLLPAECLFGNPGFWLPFHGQQAPGNCYLQLYAADLARSPDGRWWVVADRTEAPAGAGYALENRLVISRMLPGIIHERRVERLAPFFIALQQTLRRLAPGRRENPRIVLLSQGPSSPSYFEDAYLARYLGYTLVEGGDLSVRSDAVMLKTLGGLRRVDVILRRLHDEDCDPLELRDKSPLGVPGLLQAARNGHVVIANALGSGLVESPLFMAFLPILCQELLGEELLLPSVATWWCGNPDVRQYVIKNLDQVVVKPAFRRAWQEDIVGDRVGRQTTDKLVQAIESRPTDFVAQEQVARSAAPVWGKGYLQPWHIGIRAYLAADEQSYFVMPGGLARASFSSGLLDVSIAAGERSKDVWILSDKPVPPVTLLPPPGEAVVLRRGGAELPSRVADNLFWLGRYIERAEGAVRLLRTILARMTGEALSSSVPELPVLLRGLAGQGGIDPGFAIDGIKEQLPTIESALPTAAFDKNEPRSLRSTLSAMHRVASLVRDWISVDSWRILHRIDQEFHPSGPLPTSDSSELLALLNQIIIDLSAFSGLATESMTRTQAWAFLEIGRRLERSLHTIGLVRNTLSEVSPDERPVLEAILDVADSSMTYRSRYLASVQVPPVLDLLLTDQSNPRSLAFQLVALASHVDNLPRDPGQTVLTTEQRICMSAVNSIRMADVGVLSEVDDIGWRPRLIELLDELALDLPKLFDAINHDYLIHAGAPRQLAEIRPEPTK